MPSRRARGRELALRLSQPASRWRRQSRRGRARRLGHFTPECNFVVLDIKTGAQKWAKALLDGDDVLLDGGPRRHQGQGNRRRQRRRSDQPASRRTHPTTASSIRGGTLRRRKKEDPGLDTWPNLDMARHGGVESTWQLVTYDPELNLIFVTTGNPEPVVAFKNREGAICSPRRSWR